MTPEETVSALVDAYNARDAEAFAALFAEDATVALYPGQVRQRSRAEVHEHYRQSFAQYPDGGSVVAHRVVLGAFVVDHERMTRSPDEPALDLIAINEVRDGQIVRLELVVDIRPAPDR
jgi:uncharacterized protein (TIGR02246 family)